MNRRQKFLSSTMVSVTLALICFLLILAISNDFQKTWDLTADQRHSFSKQTDDFVGALSEPVKFYAFVNPAGDSSVVEALLEKYQRLSHNFTYEIVDLQLLIPRRSSLEISTSSRVRISQELSSTPRAELTLQDGVE